MMARKIRIAPSFFPVIFGGFIYIIFRGEDLVMFRWFKYLNLSAVIAIIKNFRDIFSFPEWFIYSLPDGLWVFSYIAVSLEVWKYSFTKENFFWIFSIPFFAVLSEFLQLFRIVPGTFDFIDIAFYLLGIILPCISSKINFNTKKHEKL